jgi:FRG domain
MAAGAMNWKKLGVQLTYSGAPSTIASRVIKDVAMVVANPRARYVWRGHGDVGHRLRHSLHRRLERGHQTVSDGSLAAQEHELIERARMTGYDRANNRALTDVELVALLQHEGAATRFLDVTPDPFIALFFACEHAVSRPGSAALVALRIPRNWPIRPSLAVVADASCIDQLDLQRSGEGGTASSTYLVETAFLNERMKAQRGQFVVGRTPSDPTVCAWSSLELELLKPNEEEARIQLLLNPTVGKPPEPDERPPLIVFRISSAARVSMRKQLAERFGYTTETIYPDLNGFALAFNQFATVA